jgi:hypothetical protein
MLCMTTAVILLSGPRPTPLLVIPTLMLQSVGNSFQAGAAASDKAHAAGHAFALTSLTASAVAALAALLVFLLPKAPSAKA